MWFKVKEDVYYDLDKQANVYFGVHKGKYYMCFPSKNILIGNKKEYQKCKARFEHAIA